MTLEVEETPRFVPKGEQLDRHAFKSELPADKCRVIREFVADIFDLHITEALKVFVKTIYRLCELQSSLFYMTI